MVSVPLPDEKHQREVDSEAMSWVLTHHLSDMSLGQKQSFNIWYEASEEHRRAFTRAERLWEGLHEADTLKVEAVDISANDEKESLAIANVESLQNKNRSLKTRSSKTEEEHQEELEFWEEDTQDTYLPNYFKPLLFAVITSLTLVLLAELIL